jgi:N4-gp56 family major capsid protein
MGGPFLNDLTPAILANAIPTQWEPKIRMDSARKAFWGKFVGKEGSDQPIIERMDFTNTPGSAVNIQITSQLLQEGQTGDTTLEGNEETITLGQISITPNTLRNAVAVNWRAKKQINFDIIMAIGDLLSTWIARRTDEDLFSSIVNSAVGSQLYAGAATSISTLGPATTFGVQEIMRGKAALQRQGALPIRTIVDGKQEIDWYGVVISEIDEYNLKLDSIWNTNQKDAGFRGDDNKIFTGCLGSYNGVYVYTHTSVKYSGRYGSYLRPEAGLTVALTSGSTTPISVGSNTNVNYTKFFPSSGTLLIDGEQIAYVGTSNTQLGTTSITRAQNGTTGAAHNVGALITANNLGRAIFFGAEIAARAWGMLPTRITDVRDYGYEQGIGIMAYYGQSVIQNSAGTLTPNFVLMNTYSPNPNSLI